MDQAIVWHPAGCDLYVETGRIRIAESYAVCQSQRNGYCLFRRNKHDGRKNLRNFLTTCRLSRISFDYWVKCRKWHGTNNTNRGGMENESRSFYQSNSHRREVEGRARACVGSVQSHEQPSLVHSRSEYDRHAEVRRIVRQVDSPYSPFSTHAQVHDIIAGIAIRGLTSPARRASASRETSVSG